MSKRIILTGGGTGGHITPLLAVAHKLKVLDPKCHIIYIGEKGGKYSSLTDDDPNIDETRAIFAGKFRRYHGETWLTRIFAVKTNLLNLRDLFLFLVGTLQSFVMVKKLKPDVILLKGGFVGVPVGLSAAFWRIPFITHDSDTQPGLANRIVSRWATYHATGMPPEYYGYNKQSIRYVGVLVGEDYKPVTEELQASYKDRLGVPQDSKVLLITGGSGGAGTINKAVRDILPTLMEADATVRVFHQVGIGKTSVYAGYSHERLQVFELLKPMYVYTGAADVVVTRAGANTMAELGVQGKACIVVPNPLLTGGHQLTNAKVWQDQSAAKILDENSLKQSSKLLLESINTLLDDAEQRKILASNLQRLTVTDAAQKLAELILESGRTNDTKT